MNKVIAAMNMTLNGFCDHTLGVPDEAIHEHYRDLLNNSGIALYGRVTYQLMEYWLTVLENPTGIITTDSFAEAIDRIPKLVFSNTLQDVDGWESSKLATDSLELEVLKLKQSDEITKDILVCSPSLIEELSKLDLIDEYQICIHPVIADHGMSLFKQVTKRLDLIRTKVFDFGGIILYYKPFQTK